MSTFGLIASVVNVAAPTAQYARPNNDTSTAGWSSVPLWQKISEAVRNDNDIISSTGVGLVQTFTVDLGPISDPNIHTGHLIRIVAANTGIDIPASVTVELLQSGTSIVTKSLFLNSSLTATSLTFSSGEAALITDYTTLSLRFTANKTNLSDDVVPIVSQLYFSAPIPAIVVTSSINSLYEALQYLPSNSGNVYEALGSYTTLDDYLYELTGFAVSAPTIFIEALGLLTVSRDENYESLLPLVQTNQQNYEALGTYNTNDLPLYELLGYAKNSGVSIYEALGFLSITQIENYESLAILLQTVTSNYESTGNYSVTDVTLYELLGLARTSLDLPYESLAFVPNTNVVIYEALAFVNQLAQIIYEAQGSYVATDVESYELLGFARTSIDVPYESLQLITTTSIDIYEGLGFINIGAISIWEAEGTGFVVLKNCSYELVGFATGLSDGNYESSGPISTQATGNWESESLILVTQNAVIVFESLQTATQTADINYEAVQDLLIALNQAIINYETLSINQFEDGVFIINSVTTDESAISPSFVSESGAVTIDSICETATTVGFVGEVAAPMLEFPEQEYTTPYFPEKIIVAPTFIDEFVVSPRYDNATPTSEGFVDDDTPSNPNFTDS